MDHPNDLDWLRERGVEIDSKGRAIVHLPDPDYDETVASDEPSIAELMRRDVDLRQSGSRGRRRRRAAAKAPRLAKQPAFVSNRMGRPRHGAEPRVKVRISLSVETLRTLKRRNISVAHVLEACVREWGYAP